MAMTSGDLPHKKLTYNLCLDGILGMATLLFYVFKTVKLNKSIATTVKIVCCYYLKMNLQIMKESRDTSLLLIIWLKNSGKWLINNYIF